MVKQILLPVVMLLSVGPASAEDLDSSLINGSNWTYRTTIGGSVRSTDGTGTFSSNALALRYQDSAYHFEQDFVKTTNGLELRREYGEETPEAYQDQYSLGIAVLKSSFSSGQSYSYSGSYSGTWYYYGSTVGTYSGSISGSASVSSVTVTVPAGTFAATKIATQSTTVGGDGISVTDTDVWLVDGIGLVKYAYDDTTENIQFTFELKTYNVPVSAPAAPTGLSAGDGTSTTKVALTWNAVTGATSYQVWRATSNSSAAATLLASPTTASYDDTSATAGTTYWYWVKAANAGGSSAFSSGDSGYRQVAAPAAPTGLSAGDGTSTAKVALTWNAVTGATSYQVWRATSNSSAAATLLASPATASYDDTSAVAGTIYWYWVKAANAGGSSAFSSGNSGYRQVVVPTAPTGLKASDGSYTTKVVLTWDAVENANSYLVLRHTTSDPGAWDGGRMRDPAAEILGSTSVTEFEDNTALFGVIYFYWVVAQNAGGFGPLSTSDIGYLSGSAVREIELQPGWNLTAIPAGYGGVFDLSGSVPTRIAATFFGDLVDGPIWGWNALLQVYEDTSNMVLNDTTPCWVFVTEGISIPLIPNE